MSPFLWLLLKSCFLLLICGGVFFWMGWYIRNREAWGEVLEVRKEYTEEKEGAIKLAKELEFLQGDCERLASQLEKQRTGNVPVEEYEQLQANLDQREQELAELSRAHQTLEREWRALQTSHQRTSNDLAQLRESSVSRAEYDALSITVQERENAIRGQQAAVDFAREDRGNLLNEVARLKADKIALNEEMVALHNDLELRASERDEAVAAYYQLKDQVESGELDIEVAPQVETPVAPPKGVSQAPRPSAPAPVPVVVPAPVPMPAHVPAPAPKEETSPAPAPIQPSIQTPVLLQSPSPAAPRRNAIPQPAIQSFEAEKQAPPKKRPTGEPDLFSVSSSSPAIHDGAEEKFDGTKPPGIPVPRGGKEDDLLLIKGVGPQTVERLNQLGIWHFSQVSAWTPEETAWLGNYLAFPGRIEREQWVAQAEKLSQGIVITADVTKRRSKAGRRR